MLRLGFTVVLLFLTTSLHAVDEKKVAKPAASISAHTYVGAFGEMNSRGIGTRMIKELDPNFNLTVGVDQIKSRGNDAMIDSTSYLMGVFYTPAAEKSTWYGGLHAGLQRQRYELVVADLGSLSGAKYNAVLQGEIGYKLEAAKNFSVSTHMHRDVLSQTVKEQSDSGGTMTFEDNAMSILIGFGGEYRF